MNAFKHAVPVNKAAGRWPVDKCSVRRETLPLASALRKVNYQCEMTSNHRPGPDPVRSPPEVPVTPGPHPEIEPAYRPGPEVPEPPDPGDPGGPRGPEIIPDPSPLEYPPEPSIPEPGEMRRGMAE